MPEDESSTLQICSACGAEVDVAEFEPLATVECPVCTTPMIVSKTLGPYELVEVMGRGGMGVVYRAIDHQLDRQVALKVLREDFSGDAESITKLDEEASITGGINHPHVVKVYTTGTAGGRFFIAMELVDQGTLDDLLTVQGRVAEVQALEIASHIAQGLRAAHAMGLIHRDVKPGNILFATGHQAKIVDFGLAMLEEASKGSDEIWGTPYYVSPERLDQKPEDFRSDMYSLGATIFHAIAGRPPFEAEDAGRVALKHLKSQAVSLQAFAPWVSGSTAFVINRMLNKDPAGRYDSYDELIEHLDYARAELSAGEGKTTNKKRVVLESDEDRKLWGKITLGVLGLVLVLALGTGAYFLFFAPPEQAQQGSVAVSSVGAKGIQAAEFEAARKLLVDNQAAAAAAAFNTLANREKTPQPLAQWCLLHEAICQLLLDQKTKEDTDVAALRGRKYAGTTPAERLQGEFFDKISALLSTSAPITATELTAFNRNSFGALGYLLAGLHNWQLGNFEEANTALRSFKESSPAGEFIWVAEYKPLVEDYLADLSTFRGASGMAKSAKTKTEFLVASQTLLKAKGDLRKGAATIGPKLEAAAQEALDKMKTAPGDATSQNEAEKAAFADARNKAIAACKAWNFQEASGLLNGVPLANIDFNREQRLLTRKVEWLARFKAQLIKDLAKGYAESIKLANGTPKTGPIVKATEGGVDFGKPDAQLEGKKWAELAPESICAIAESFIPATLPAPEAGERRWLLGVYAVLGKQLPLAKRSLLESAKGNTQRSELIGLLMPPRRVDLGRLPKASITASDFTQTPNKKEDPANVLDGKNDTRWESKAPGEKWLRLDFGKQCQVIRWTLKHAHSYNEPPELNLADFVFQSSVDDQAWTDVDAVQNNTLDVTDRRVGRFDARYVRLLIKKPNRLAGNDPTAHLYGFEVMGSESDGEPVADFFATTPSAPPEFSGHDIGLAATDASGSTDERNGIFNLRSASAGIGPTADACRFLHQPIRDHGEIVIRLDAVEQAHLRSEAGVMVRAGLAPDAPSAYLGLAVGGQITWNVRKAAGGELTEAREIGIGFPCWLRLEEKGKGVTGAWSRDGKTWKTIGSETVDLGSAPAMGVASMSHAPRTFSTARFEVINFLR